MLCECGQAEATVHEIIIKGGKKIERHFCEKCARAQGIQVDPQQPVKDLLSTILQTAKSGTGAAGPAACPACGLAFTAFRQSGLLGCPRCYEAFEARLIPLIERAHEGASRHVGKRPVRAAPGLEEQRAVALRRLLDQAVATEQFERAARLRDELRKIEGEP